MSSITLIISVAAVIASCQASGVGHFLPHAHVAAVKSFPVVRYSPFYSFPTPVRSIHTISPGFPAVAPALAAAPILPPPLPAQVVPAPVFNAPLPVAPPVWPAPAPAPVFPAPAVPVAPPPVFAPAYPRFAPVPAAPIYARPVPAFNVAPFSPIVRPVAAPFPPAVAVPEPVAIAKHIPYSFGAPVLPAPVYKQFAWK
ncbi:unnamed protein product [Leptidea sinapis]|uniref:VM domain-containing protein n=1 Tax=Leptidea sinapis TaxID=189913 RepID=A0A5E4QT42_9NEOP|nr:unnamed protein product [Leptidea sinapis]